MSGRYYYSDIPFLALWGSKYVPISRSYPQFLADCASGDLPAVAYLDPRFGGEEEGLSNDDHPHADVRVGQAFLNDVYNAVRTSPAWPTALLVITYDEWGGFFDHVPPGLAPDVYPPFERRGFRVPALIVSPRARRGYVSRDVFDHTSVLRLIEWRWNLNPLSLRDEKAANLAAALGTDTVLSGPAFTVPPAVPVACSSGAQPVREIELADLARLARKHGWPV